LVAADIPSLSATYQPLDADLTALAGLSGTNNIYYRSAANTWTSVAFGTGLSFSGGTLSNSSGGVDSDVTLTDNRNWDFAGFTLTIQDSTAAPYVPANIAATNGLNIASNSLGAGLTVDCINGDNTGAIFNVNFLGTTYFTVSAGYTEAEIFRSNQNKLLATGGGITTITPTASASNFARTEPAATGTYITTGNLTDITGTGTLTSGATGAGFTLALSTSTITGTLPASKGGTGLTSLGTGVATALGVNVGSVGAPVLFNGAGGTPSSLVLTNATGLSGSSVSGGTFGAVNGSALTALNATNIASGTLDAARLPATAQLTTGTLALNGFGSVTGTLAAARIADLSATYLTVAAAAAGYQPLDADLTAIAALGGTSTQYYRSGAGAWSAVTYGTGLSFSGGVLTPELNGATGSTDNVILRADGTGTKTVQGGGVLTLSDAGALGFPDGVSQVFNPNATNAGLNVGSYAGDPSTPANGDLWYDSTANELTARINGANIAIGGASLGANTFTGAQLVTVAGAASTPAVKLSGLLFSGGSATTTKPQLLVEETAAVASNDWSTSGTAIGANVDTAFAGNLLDAKVEDVSKFKVNAAGTVTLTGIVGTAAVGDATAGSVGEYVNSLVPVGSAVGLSNGADGNVTSISLTAGDWDLTGAINFVSASATVTQKSAGITVTSATIPTDGSEVFNGSQTTTASFTDGITLPVKRINVSSTTTVYLVGKVAFSAGSVSAFGTINARRVR